MRGDLGKQYRFPKNIAEPNVRADTVLGLESSKQVVKWRGWRRPVKVCIWWMSAAHGAVKLSLLDIMGMQKKMVKMAVD